MMKSMAVGTEWQQILGFVRSAGSHVFKVMNLKREHSSAHGISASVASLLKHEPWEGALGETMAIATTRDVKRISPWS